MGEAGLPAGRTNPFAGALLTTLRRERPMSSRRLKLYSRISIEHGAYRDSGLRRFSLPSLYGPFRGCNSGTVHR